MKAILLAFAALILSGCCFVADQGRQGYYQPDETYLPPAQGSGAGQVRINSHTLSNAELTAFRNYYGVEPQPGDYWYDSQSGLYGSMGQPAAGFINPGHEFGPLAPYASGGTSGVMLNGRELTAEELDFIEYTYGMELGQGEYYLDEQGYLGGDDYYVNTFDYYGEQYDSSDLYYGGGTDVYGDSGMYYGQIANDWGGGGDNFWSTGYGAGNSEGGCTYVNVGGDFATSGCG